MVIGVHTPEFAFEKSVANVKNAVADLKIGYPVAIDNNYAIWRAFGNEYWPAHYFIDAEGRIRHHHFGEGDYEESERIIQTLLQEAGEKKVAAGLVLVKASGAEAARMLPAYGRPRPISAMSEPKTSSRRVARCGISRTPMPKALHG